MTTWSKKKVHFTISPSYVSHPWWLPSCREVVKQKQWAGILCYRIHLPLHLLIKMLTRCFRRASVISSVQKVFGFLRAWEILCIGNKGEWVWQQYGPSICDHGSRSHETLQAASSWWRSKIQKDLINLNEVIQQFLVLSSDKLLPKVSAVVVIMLVSTLINRLDWLITTLSLQLKDTLEEVWYWLSPVVWNWLAGTTPLGSSAP